MKNPNGYGGISKLPGNRRKPRRAQVRPERQHPARARCDVEELVGGNAAELRMLPARQ